MLKRAERDDRGETPGEMKSGPVTVRGAVRCRAPGQAMRCLLGLAAATLASAAERPNFLVVLIDDLGWADFSCFGNTEAATPNIDRLAREGRRFERFYVAAPICSPSRVGLSTGQYPHRWRITSYLNNRAENAARGMADWLDPRAPMLARALKDSGYATGHFGKWHMGGQRDVGEAPLITAYGFDESLTNFEGLGPRVLPLLDARDGKPPRKHALGSDNLGRGDIIWKDRAEVTPAFVAAAIDFIRRSAAAGRPFYVNLWPDDVHSPFFPVAGRRGDGTKRMLYHAVLETMDAQLGPVFDEIRANPKLRGNTLVLVCSDNGPEAGAGSAGGLRGSKAMLYEGGIRSPLVVWGPGLIAGGRVGAAERDSVIAAIDVAPSLLAIAGVKPPAGGGLDGVARHEVLLGNAVRARERPLYFRRPPDRGSFSGVANLPDLAVVDGNWKLLCEYDGSAVELYDLAADPAESINLAGTHPAVAARLSTLVRDWHRAMPPDLGATYRTPASMPPAKKRRVP